MVSDRPGAIQLRHQLAGHRNHRFGSSIPGFLAITLIAPLAIQEMVLAFCFTIKGFDHDALALLAAA